MTQQPQRAFINYRNSSDRQIGPFKLGSDVYKAEPHGIVTIPAKFADTIKTRGYPLTEMQDFVASDTSEAPAHIEAREWWERHNRVLAEKVALEGLLKAAEKRGNDATRRAEMHESEASDLRAKLDLAERKQAQLEIELRQVKHGLKQEVAAIAPENLDTIDPHGEPKGPKASKQNQRPAHA